MKTTMSLLFVFLIFTALWTPAVLAQQPDPQEEPELLTLEGELIAVDLEAGLITVKSTDGAEVQFIYTAETEVMGGEGSVEGLSTQSGTQVIVHYRSDDMVNTAIRVEITS